jgi:hypothetical protein
MVVPSILTQAKPEATHDSDRIAGQTIDVVPDGTGAMAIQGCCIQSLQSRSLGPGEECDIPDPFSEPSLAGSGKVLQMLWFRMHDVEMG